LTPVRPASRCPADTPASGPWVISDLPGFEAEEPVNPVPLTAAPAGEEALAGVMAFDIRTTSQQAAEAALAGAGTAASSGSS